MRVFARGKDLERLDKSVARECDRNNLTDGSSRKHNYDSDTLDAICGLSDLPLEAPSFKMRVCGFGFHIPRLRFEQARRARSSHLAQAIDVLERVFYLRVMNGT